jgi:hypothetical protein
MKKKKSKKDIGFKDIWFGPVEKGFEAVIWSGDSTTKIHINSNGFVDMIVDVSKERDKKIDDILND